MDKTRSVITAVAIVLFLAVLPTAAIGADDPNLVGWWTLDEDTGTVAFDASGHGNNAIFQGTPQWVGDGRFGSAVQFNGTTDYLAAPDSDSLDLKGDRLTLSGWVRGVSWATNHVIRKIADTGNGAIYLLRVQAAGLRADIATPGMTTILGTTPLPTQQWVHIALVYDGAQARVYVNGVVNGQASVSGKIAESNNELRIGRGEPAGYFNGSLDDLRVYNRALADNEIKALNPPKLQAYQPIPANGDRAAATPLLQWTAGETAVLHDVYLGASPDLGPANLVSARTTMTMYYHGPGFQPGTTYYWRVDEIEADLTTVHTGNVWTFTTQAATAYQPSPASGDGEVSTAAVLAWLPGKDALKHHLYFGDSRDAVTQGTAAADKGEQTQKETTFTPAGLVPAATYCWRVDEILIDGTVRTGPVWTFSTFLPVEDFEAYTDQEGNRVYEIWPDGSVDKSTGSIVGLYPNAVNGTFCETTIVHGGKQSMPLEFNNVKAPFYSETDRQFTPARDWTVNAADALILYVRGVSSNSPAPLYLAVEDSAHHLCVVTCPDGAVVTAGRWSRWQIPFGDFTAASVDLTRIQRLYLGLGDRKKPTAGGAGRIYVDDIRVVRTAPAQ